MTLKTLRISENTHTQLKLFCVQNKLKVNSWADTIIKNYVEKNRHKTIRS